MQNAPNRRPVWRRVLLGLLAFPLLIGLGVASFVASFSDPGIWTLVGWAVLAGVLAGILHAVAPPHAAWPPALVALWTVALSWESPWQAITSGMAFPWVVLILLSQAFFVTATVAGVGYAAHCSQTGTTASWPGYRVYASVEVPKFVGRVTRAIRTRTARIERVK